MSCPRDGAAESSRVLNAPDTRCNALVGESSDESPAAPQLAHREHQLIAPLADRQIDRVILGIHDSEEAGVAEALRAPSPEQDPAIQEDAHLVGVAEGELAGPLAVRVDDGP